MRVFHQVQRRGNGRAASITGMADEAAALAQVPLMFLES